MQQVKSTTKTTIKQNENLWTPGPMDTATKPLTYITKSQETLQKTGKKDCKSQRVREFAVRLISLA